MSYTNVKNKHVMSYNPGFSQLKKTCVIHHSEKDLFSHNWYDFN